MSQSIKNIKDDFINTGIIEIKNFISKKELLKLIKNIEMIEKTSDNLVSKYYEKKFLIRIENFLEKNNFLKKFINSKKIKSKVDQLIGGKSILFKEKINFKPFGSRKDKLHQDIQAGWSKYDKNMVTCLIAIDHSTTKNGCLEFDVSGNNSKKQRAKNFSPLLVKDLHEPKFKKFILKPGDAIFFNAYAPHRSSKNLKTQYRRNLYLTYNLKKKGNFRSKYFSDKEINFPPNSRRDKSRKYNYKI